MTEIWNSQTNVLMQRGIARESSLILLLRHADRGPLPEDEPGNEIPLLPSGVERAVAFGSALGASLGSIHTSPVLRCVQTAEFIVEGAGLDLQIVSDPHLGAPGVYVTEGEIAWKAWQTMGHEGVVTTLMEGTQLPGFADPMDATRELVDWMRDVVGERRGVHIFVTHDILVTVAAAHCLGRRLPIDEWPGFLEHLILYEEHSRRRVSYRGSSTGLVS